MGVASKQAFAALWKTRNFDLANFDWKNDSSATPAIPLSVSHSPMTPPSARKCRYELRAWLSSLTMQLPTAHRSPVQTFHALEIQHSIIEPAVPNA
jgi:hypothetical protein